MKNNMKKLLIVFICILTLTGCGSKNYLVDKNKKMVTYDKTGQTLPTNILCKPTDKKLLETYEKYESQLKKPLKEIPECSKYKIAIKDSNSLWEGLFIRPLAFLIIKLGKLLNNYGWSVILIGLAIRVLLLPVSLKTQKQAENMKKITPEMKKIEAKYANQTSNDAMMAKSQEMMMLYKKYKVSPFSSCLLAFIQLPLFLAFLQAINRVPVIFEDSLFGMRLGMTPLHGLKTGNYIYIALILLIIVTTYLSLRKALSNTAASDDQARSIKTTLYFSIGLIVFTSFNLSTAIGLYWVATNGFIVIQNAIIQKMIENGKEKRDNRSHKSKKKVSIKEKAERRR